MDEAGVTKLVDFIQIKGTPDQVLKQVESFNISSAAFDQGIEELTTVVNGIQSLGVPEENFCIDFSIARGLDYYTGTVYETTLRKHPEIGSVCSGGRYDNLAGFYTKKMLPGVGMSIGLTRLFYILNEKEYIGEGASAPSDVLIVPFSADDYGAASKINAYLISRGIRSQVYFENKKIKAKMRYADSLGIPFVILLGEDEIANNTVALKKLSDGTQQQLSKEEAATLIVEEINAAADEKIINMNK
jgi:histidyl-tRNA synthetase